MKKPSHSVDEDTLKRYHKPFFDKIIEAKTAVLGKDVTSSIKDVEVFMGNFAENVIKQGEKAIVGYEIQLRERQ